MHRLPSLFPFPRTRTQNPQVHAVLECGDRSNDHIHVPHHALRGLLPLGPEDAAIADGVQHRRGHLLLHRHRAQLQQGDLPRGHRDIHQRPQGDRAHVPPRLLRRRHDGHLPMVRPRARVWLRLKWPGEALEASQARAPSSIVPRPRAAASARSGVDRDPSLRHNPPVQPHFRHPAHKPLHGVLLVGHYAHGGARHRQLGERIIFSPIPFPSPPFPSLPFRSFPFRSLPIQSNPPHCITND